MSHSPKSTPREPASERSRAPLPVWKKLMFSGVMLVLVFGTAELVLWAAGTETVLELQDPFRGFSGLVKVFEKKEDRYRTRPANANAFNDQSFLVEKPENGLRIFCLGGSSSYGFPWGAEAAFTSVLGELLSASHPELQVEAVNVSGVSYAMHRLNIIADELLEYEPDILVIYSGHNEFIEPVFMEALKNRSPIRTRIEFAAAHSRVYSGIWHAVHSQDVSPVESEKVTATVLREHGIFSMEEKEEVVAQYRERLKRLVLLALKADVKVVLSTVPCNQREWSPEASAAVSSLSEQDRQKWSVAFAAGKRHLENSQLPQAETELQRAVALAPGHADGQYLLAKTYDRLGKWQEAREAYDRAVDLDASPIRRVSGINTAIREVAAQFDTLLIDADDIFTEQSEHGLLGFNLIKDYVHPTLDGHELIAWHMWDQLERSGWLGNKSEASRDVFEQVVANRTHEMTGDKASWFFNQGVLLEKQGQLTAAMESYQEALILRSDFVPALNNLGALLAKTGRPQDALRALEQAIQLNPDEPGVHNNYGGVLKLMGRLPEALKHFQAELELTGSEQANVHLNMGVTLQGMGRLDEAVKEYQEVLRIEPDSSDAHMYWGSLLLQQKQLEGAQTQFRRALELNPDQAHSYSNLGVVLLRMQRFEEGAEQFRKAIELSPDYAVAYKNLGLCLAPQGKFAEALAQFKRAMEIDPGVPGIRDLILRAEAAMKPVSTP